MPEYPPLKLVVGQKYAVNFVTGGVIVGTIGRTNYGGYTLLARREALRVGDMSREYDLYHFQPQHVVWMREVPVGD